MSQQYYIVEGDLYLNAPFDFRLLSNEGVEIHARGDVWFGVDKPPSKMKKADQFIDINKFPFPIKDVVAFSKKCFSPNETKDIINS